MTDCLNDMQIEDVLAGSAEPEGISHVDACPQCRQRVEAAKAVRTRLRKAVGSIHAPLETVDRIRALTVGQPDKAPGRPARPPWVLRHWGTLAAAASVLIIVSLAVVVNLVGPTPAEAAASELVQLHQHNMTGHDDLVRHGSHAETQAYLTEKLGFTPAVPDELGNRRIRGCCVSRFLGRRAGTMVVEGPGEPISIIVSDANARPLQTDRSIHKDGRTYWVCPMQGFFTVAVQEDGLIYCAVGKDTPEHLAELLDEILSRHTMPPTD